MSPPETDQWPLNVFRFRVDFHIQDLNNREKSGNITLCSGAFSECTGLDATMEPKVIKEGGLNYGANQRAGAVTFGTVVLKRGMTRTRDLWKWFSMIGGGGYAYRLGVEIVMLASSDQRTKEQVDNKENEVGALTIKLYRALPVKFRAADLNALGGSTIAIEEIHLAHEGMTMVTSG
jgi:phage tail-like protein